jgi:hypothetical protein
MKQIEYTVGKHNPSTVPALKRDRFNRLSSVHDSTAPKFARIARAGGRGRALAGAEGRRP